MQFCWSIFFMNWNLLSYQVNTVSAREVRQIPTLLVSLNMCQSLDSVRRVDVIYIDFQKAFHKIEHSIPLNNVTMVRIHKLTASLFHSYLTDRVNFMKYRNCHSTSYSPSSGVPQGPNLGLLIFSLFINDIADFFIVNSEILADDLKIYLLINSVEDCNSLQNNIE